MTELESIRAIVAKELKLAFRFKLVYFNAVFGSAVTGIFFLVIYSGIFSTGFRGIGGLTGSNFVAFVLLGTVAASLVNSSMSVFLSSFRTERSWQVLPFVLASPVERSALLIGYGLTDLLRNLPSMLALFLLSFFVSPTGVDSVVATAVVMLLLWFGTLGLGLLRAALFLINENWETLFFYIALALLFFSAFYYPIEALPGQIRFIAYLNPIYFGTQLARGYWLGTALAVGTFGLVLFAVYVILLPILGVALFDRIWRSRELQGY